MAGAQATSVIRAGLAALLLLALPGLARAADSAFDGRAVEFRWTTGGTYPPAAVGVSTVRIDGGFAGSVLQTTDGDYQVVLTINSVAGGVAQVSIDGSSSLDLVNEAAAWSGEGWAGRVEFSDGVAVEFGSVGFRRSDEWSAFEQVTLSGVGVLIGFVAWQVMIAGFRHRAITM